MLLDSFGFLTILPIRGKRPSITYFPLVGLFIGACLFLLNLCFSKLFSKEITILFILLFFYYITGGLHLDGFSDTIDGIMGGRSRNERLRIMENSHIGSFATCSIFFLLGLKFFFLLELPDKALLLFPLMGRYGMVISILFSHPAKEYGLGNSFIQEKRAKNAIFPSIFTLATSFFLIGLKGIILLFFIFFIGLFLSLYFKRKIGGLTGDTLGFVCEVSELSFLLGYKI